MGGSATRGNGAAALAARVSHALGVKRLLRPLLGHPRAAQVIKWTVYISLIINMGQYFVDDYRTWQATVASSAEMGAWIEAFSTSIDVIGWIGLIFLFELETYQLSDDAYTRVVAGALRIGRLLCYGFIGYAATGYFGLAMGNYEVESLGALANLCQFADQGLWLQWGQVDYTEITSASCATLPPDSLWYRFTSDSTLVGASVLPHIRFMGWIDLLNAIAWLIVVFMIEVEVRLQNEDRFSSRLLAPTRLIKTLMYLILIGNGVLWACFGYVLYAWDAFLWIFGFWAIELNLAEWEQERVEELEQEELANTAI